MQYDTRHSQTICGDVVSHCRASSWQFWHDMSRCRLRMSCVVSQCRIVISQCRIVVSHCRVSCPAFERRATLRYDARQCDTTGDNAIRHSTFSNDMSQCRIALSCVAYGSGARRRHCDMTSRQCDTTLDILKRHCRDVAVDRCSLKYIPVLTHISSGELVQ